MIFSYIHSAHSHAGHPLQTKIMMTQTKYDDRHLILVTPVSGHPGHLGHHGHSAHPGHHGHPVLVIYRAESITVSFFSLFEEVGRFGAVESCQHLLFFADHCSTYNIL